MRAVLTKRQIFNEVVRGKPPGRRLAAATAMLLRSIGQRLQGYAARIASRELFEHDVLSQTVASGFAPKLSTDSDGKINLILTGGYLSGTTIGFRPGSSDLHVFSQICLGKEYQPLLDLIKQREDTIATVIDAGANIGLTTIFLKRFHPAATVVAIEPDDGNFSMLEKNLAGNGLVGVHCLRAGLWPREESLEVDRSFRDHLEWSISLKANPTGASTGNVRGMTLDRIKRDFVLSRIDILKIDIEGGERHLFSDPATARETLDGVRYLALEIHDEFNIRERIQQMLSKNGFVFFEVGETLFAFRR